MAIANTTKREIAPTHPDEMLREDFMPDLADGRKDALFFLGGGLLGALIYTVVYGSIEGFWIFDKIAGGKVMLADGRRQVLIPAAYDTGLVAGRRHRGVVNDHCLATSQQGLIPNLAY